MTSRNFESASNALKVPPRTVGPYFPSASERSTGICREAGCRWAEVAGGGNGAIDGAAAALFAGYVQHMKVVELGCGPGAARIIDTPGRGKLNLNRSVTHDG